MRQLTDGGIDDDPSWSPDGRQLVFARCCYAVFTIDADGSDLTHVVDVEGQPPGPSFSPSGRRILYTTGDSIRTIGADGTDLREVGNGIRAADPRYSPDGARIVFSLGAIWSMRRDGSHRRVLTDPDAAEDPGGAGVLDSAPDYSPDGRFIAFHRCGRVSCDPLRVMRADGSDERSVPDADNAGSPAWGPAGDRIALPLFTGTRGLGPLCSDLYTIAPTGADRQNLTMGCDEHTATGSVVVTPSWQPDPPSTLTFRGLKRNTTKGTAKLDVGVLGPGGVELARNKKLKGKEKSAAGEGTVTLPIKPKRKARKQLNRKGKAKVRAKVTYTPDGAGPNTVSKRIALRKHG